MKKLVTKILLTAAVITSAAGQCAYASDPDIYDFEFGLQLLQAKTGLGQDGNSRVIWDNFDNGVYTGSSFWILDSTGALVAAGSPGIPASIGYGIITGESKSNIILYGQADGNTTLAFPFGASGTPPTPGSFAVWTYNSAGALISAATYGPYGATTYLRNLYFSPSGTLIAKWLSNAGTGLGVKAVWSLNEYGAIQTSAGPFGPYVNTALGKVDVKNGTVYMYWSGPIFGSTTKPHFLNVWTLNSTGQILTAFAYGPY
jgi:hypothetical protein